MIPWQEGDNESLERLRKAVDGVAYKQGWQFALHWMERPSEHLTGSQGWTLCISAEFPDSKLEGKMTGAQHWFAPPPASWSLKQWQRWVFDCIVEMETHEAMEFVRFDQEAVFFPAHGPGGNSPYLIQRRG